MKSEKFELQLLKKDFMGEIEKIRIEQDFSEPIKALKREIDQLKLNISDFSDEILSFSVNDVQVGFQWV